MHIPWELWIFHTALLIQVLENKVLKEYSPIFSKIMTSAETICAET